MTAERQTYNRIHSIANFARIIGCSRVRLEAEDDEAFVSLSKMDNASVSAERVVAGDTEVVTKIAKARLLRVDVEIRMPAEVEPTAEMAG